MSRPIAQKITLLVAGLSYAGALACALGAFFYPSQREDDPIVASLMAAVVFFVGCGVVLQVIGTARLQGLLSGSGDHEPE